MRGAVALRLVSDVLARLVALAALPLVVRAYGAPGYGTYALVTAVGYFAVPLVTLSLGQSLVRFREAAEAPTAARARLRRVTLVVLGLLCLLGATGTVVASLMTNVAAVLLAGCALVAVLAVEQLLLDHLRAVASFYRYGAVQIAIAGATLIVLLFGPARADEIATLILLLVVVRAPVAALLLTAALVGSTPQMRVSLRPMLGFAFPLVVAGLGAWAIYLTGRFAVAGFLDRSALGAYSAALTAAGVLTLISNALGLPAYPRMVAAAGRGTDALHAEFLLFRRLTAYALFPTAALVGLQLPVALDVLDGREDLNLGLLAATLIVLAAAMEQWNVPVQYALLASGQSRRVRDAWLVAGGVNVAACLALIPFWGLVGAGVAGVASMGAFLAVNQLSLRRELTSLRGGPSLRRTAVASLACSAAVLLVGGAAAGSGNVIRLLAGSGAGLVAFVASLALLHELPEALRFLRARPGAPRVSDHPVDG